MKNYIILEIRPDSEQVVFAVENRDGVAQTFTEGGAALEIDRLNREWPTFRFQIVKLAL